MLILQFTAVLTAMLFSGAAIYINLVEHPARMECGTSLAATEFGPSYRRAAVMQAILALASTIAGLGAWFMGGPRLWFVGAVLIFAVIPFTLIAIMPTNKQLLDPALDRSSPLARRLMQDWGKLHAVRSILAFAASVIFLSTLIWP
ncbi:MAG: DUF1772 domain-containing protein [Candidatus Solibacter usitatus]|nr:DUF1772 domain-containing protein [Candidatus Solibacter usitatus]